MKGDRPYLYPSPFIQNGQGIGDYLGPFFRMIKPWLFRGAKSGAKALGRAVLQTGCYILSDIADKPEGYKVIISKHIRESLSAKMAGGGLLKRRRPPSRTRCPSAKRRKRAPSTRRKPRGKTPKRKRGGPKRWPPIKRDLFA